MDEKEKGAEFTKIVNEIKERLKGKSYSEISDILLHIQSDITEELIY